MTGAISQTPPPHLEMEILQLTQRLLDCIAQRDWAGYQELCDEQLSAFEPEAHGHLVVGLSFHKFFFDESMGTHYGQSTICAPHVKLLGPDAAVIAYVRLTQKVDQDGRIVTACFEETRVWQRREDGHWRHVHFHRSANR